MTAPIPAASSPIPQAGEAAGPTIFAFVAYETLDPCGHTISPDFVPRPQLQRLCHGRAVTADGEVLDADHPSSSAGWSRHDMTDDWKRENVYAKRFPDGFDLVWLDVPGDHPLIGQMLRDGHPRLTDPAARRAVAAAGPAPASTTSGDRHA